METTNKDFGNAAVKENRLLVSCWKTSKSGVKTLIGSEYEVGDLLADIQKADFIIAHNSKMELKWLQRCGLDLHTVLAYCTMIGEYQLAGNRQVAKDLGSVSDRYGQGVKDKYIDGMLQAGVCPSELPLGFVIARCKKDVLQTEQVFLRQRARLANEGKLQVQYTACLVTPVLADIEMRGMYLDKARVYETHRSLTERKAVLDRRLQEVVGDVNLNSPKQVRELLYERMKFRPLKIKGQPVYGTDVDTLDKLDADTPEQAEFLKLKREQSALNAALSKNINKFKECVDNDDLLLGLFNQTVTQTHRLSSSGAEYKIQFQNMDRDFKKLFRSRHKGWKTGEADGAQIEFRVAVFWGQDLVGYNSILNGEDVHAYTSEVMTAAGQPTNRQDAKPHTFKPLYGGMSGTPAERAYYAAFRKKYPGIAAIQEAWKRTVLLTKKLRLSTGLEFFWPDTQQTRDGYITNSTQICNYPVQYLATGEIVLIAITWLWHLMWVNGMESFLVNTVHDSAVAEIHPDEQELFKELSVKAFTEHVYDYLAEVYGIEFNVPLGVGIKIGDYWSEGSEIKLQVEPPFDPPEEKA